MSKKLSFQLFKHKEAANKTPIIILHGLFGNKNIWRPLLQRDNGILRVNQHATRAAFTLDLRNHGESFHDRDMSYEAMSKDLCEFIEHEGLERVILMGHSMGGKTIMHFCLNEMERASGKNFEVEKCVIGDIGPVSYLENPLWTIPSLVKAMKELPMDFSENYKTRQHVDAHLARYVPDQRVRMLLALNLERRADNLGWRWNVNLPAILDNVHHIGGFPSTSTIDKSYNKDNILFVRGGSSFYCHGEYEDEIRRLFPRHCMETIPNAGHWLHSDNPDMFSTIVREFVNS